MQDKSDAGQVLLRTLYFIVSNIIVIDRYVIVGYWFPKIISMEYSFVAHFFVAAQSLRPFNLLKWLS